jgi:adenine deaminase
MGTNDRRRFVAGMGAAFALGTMSGAVRAAMGPNDKFDLVIKGGELLDPALKLRGKRDIGIRVMSKFMALGFTLEQVVQMASAAPARIINRMPMLGSLQVGAPGDATLVELVQGPVEFVDTRNNKRSGKAYIKPVQAVLAGVPFGRPYQAPFSVR